VVPRYLVPDPGLLSGDINDTPPEGPCRKKKPLLKTWEPRYIRLVCWCNECRGKLLLEDGKEDSYGDQYNFLDGSPKTGQLDVYDTKPPHHIWKKINRPLTKPRGSSIKDLKGCTTTTGTEMFSGWFFKSADGRDEKHEQSSLKIITPDPEDDQLRWYSFPTEKIRDEFNDAIIRIARGLHWRNIDYINFFRVGVQKLLSMGAMTYEGIFRKAGNETNVDAMMTRYKEGMEPKEIFSLSDEIDDVATFFKRWLMTRELIPQNKFDEAESLLAEYRATSAPAEPASPAQMSNEDPNAEISKKVFKFIESLDEEVSWIITHLMFF